jgi:hypothetical protein
LPRGLGDDPLARRKDRRRKNTSTGDTTDIPAPTQATGPLATTATVDQIVSHNDVFFRRRSEATSPQTLQPVEHQQVGTVPNGAVGANKVPEIAEAIDIVRIAEATRSTRAVGGQETEQITGEATFSASSAKGMEESIPVIETQPHVVNEENVAITDDASVPQAIIGKQAEPESRRKGILNRLFKRFGR